MWERRICLCDKYEHNLTIAIKFYVLTQRLAYWSEALVVTRRSWDVSFEHNGQRNFSFGKGIVDNSSTHRVLPQWFTIW